MKALVFEKSIPRYAAARLIGSKRAAKLATSRWGVLCPVKLRDVREPVMPGPEWVRIRPTLSGICGSDLSVIAAKGSPYLSPLTSTPFVMGHELVGAVTEIGDGVRAFESQEGCPAISVGDRVTLEPSLGCVVRGISPRCTACARNQPAMCRNVTRGVIARGIQTGYCRDTGGGWSGGLVAHRTQLFRIPDGISDRAAVLAEPLSCVLHGILRAPSRVDETILVIGCGSIGLLAIAALRARACRSRIVAVAKHEHQRRFAVEFGADVVMKPVGTGRDRARGYREWAETLDGELHHPEIGKPTVIGGADVTLDCIGSSESIDDAMRFTRSGGRVVLIGMPGIPSNVDWTAIWYKELSLHASYAYGPELINGDATGSDPKAVSTWDLATHVLSSWGGRLEGLVGEPFELDDYRSAFAAALFAGHSRSVKTVFRITS